MESELGPWKYNKGDEISLAFEEEMVPAIVQEPYTAMIFTGPSEVRGYWAFTPQGWIKLKGEKSWR